MKLEEGWGRRKRTSTNNFQQQLSSRDYSRGANYKRLLSFSISKNSTALSPGFLFSSLFFASLVLSCPIWVSYHLKHLKATVTAHAHLNKKRSVFQRPTISPCSRFHLIARRMTSQKSGSLKQTSPWLLPLPSFHSQSSGGNSRVRKTFPLLVNLRICSFELGRDVFQRFRFSKRSAILKVTWASPLNFVKCFFPKRQSWFPSVSLSIPVILKPFPV